MYSIWVFDTRAHRYSTSPKHKTPTFRFRADPAVVTVATAVVLTQKLASVSSDGARQFDLGKMSRLSSFMQNKYVKNEATTVKKIFEVAEKLELTDFDIYLRTDNLTIRQGSIKLSNDYTQGTHFVAFRDHYYFDSFCVEPPPQNNIQPITQAYPSKIL